jgi:hypothetical protein
MPRAARYEDQWNIILPSSASVDELRTCVLYEYARECETFVDLVEKHRRAPHDTAHSEHQGLSGLTYLDYIEACSTPLANLVRAMGSKASLMRPWSRLSSALRAKMVAAHAASVRLATADELEQSYGWHLCFPEPAPGTLFDIDPICDDAAGEDPRRLLSLILDTRAPAAAIKEDIIRLFDKKIAPLLGGARGRGASGKEPLLAALRALAVLRLLSSRALPIAQTVAARAGRSDLLQERKKDSTRYQRMEHARQTFRRLFPSLFHGEEFVPPQPMLSDAAYLAHNTRAPGRKRRR